MKFVLARLQSLKAVALANGDGNSAGAIDQMTKLGSTVNIQLPEILIPVGDTVLPNTIQEAHDAVQAEIITREDAVDMGVIKHVDQLAPSPIEAADGVENVGAPVTPVPPNPPTPGTEPRVITPTAPNPIDPVNPKNLDNPTNPNPFSPVNPNPVNPVTDPPGGVFPGQPQPGQPAVDPATGQVIEMPVTNGGATPNPVSPGPDPVAVNPDGTAAGFPTAPSVPVNQGDPGDEDASPAGDQTFKSLDERVDKLEGNPRRPRQ